MGVESRDCYVSFQSWAHHLSPPIGVQSMRIGIFACMHENEFWRAPSKSSTHLALETEGSISVRIADSSVCDGRGCALARTRTVFMDSVDFRQMFQSSGNALPLSTRMHVHLCEPRPRMAYLGLCLPALRCSLDLQESHHVWEKGTRFPISDLVSAQ